MTNQQRVQRGLGPLEAPAEGDDSPCVDENFEQDFYENYDNLSENENFSGEDKSNKNKFTVVKKPMIEFTVASIVVKFSALKEI